MSEVVCFWCCVQVGSGTDHVGVDEDSSAHLFKLQVLGVQIGWGMIALAVESIANPFFFQAIAATQPLHSGFQSEICKRTAEVSLVFQFCASSMVSVVSAQPVT